MTALTALTTLTDCLSQKIYALQKQVTSLKAQLEQLMTGYEAATAQRFVREGKTSARSTTISRGAMVTSILDSHPEFVGMRRVSPASYAKVSRLMKNCRTAEELEAALLELDNFKTYVVTPTATPGSVSEMVPYATLSEQVKELTKYVVEEMGRRKYLVPVPTLPLDFNGAHDFRRGMGWRVLELLKTEGGTPAQHWEKLERDYKALKNSGKSGSGGKRKAPHPKDRNDDRPVAPFIVAGPTNRDGAPAVPPPPQALVVAGPSSEEYRVIFEATKHLVGAESTQRVSELTFECIAKREGHDAAARYMHRLFPAFQVPPEPVVAVPPPPMEVAQEVLQQNPDAWQEDIQENYLTAVQNKEIDNAADVPGDIEFDAVAALQELHLHHPALAFNNDFLADQFESDFPAGVTFNFQPVQQVAASAPTTTTTTTTLQKEVESVVVVTVRAEKETETLLVETTAPVSKPVAGKIRVVLTNNAKPSVFPTTTLPPRQQNGTVVLGSAGRMIDGRKLFSHPQRQPTAAGREETDLDELIPVRSNYAEPIVIDDIGDDIEEEEEDDEDSSSIAVSSASSLAERKAALKKIIAESSPVKSSLSSAKKKAKLVIEDEPSQQQSSSSVMSSVDTASAKKPATSVPPKKNKAAAKKPASAKKPAPTKKPAGKRTVDERPAHDDEEPAVLIAAAAAAAAPARGPRRRKSEEEKLEPWAFDPKRAEADKKFVFVVPSDAKARQEFEVKKREREMQQRNRVWGRHI